MSKKYTSPEHAIRNIMEAPKLKVKELEPAYELGQGIADLYRKIVPETPTNLPAVKPSTSSQAAGRAAERSVPVSTPEATPSVKSSVTTKTEPVVKSTPEVKPETTSVVKSTPEVKTETPPAVKSTPETTPAVRSVPEVKPSVKSPDTPAVKSPDSPNVKSVRSFPIFGITPGQPIALTAGSVFGVGDYLHMAKIRTPDLDAPIHEESADEERRKIENVARPNSDRNKVMARNESIKKKIIDENVKKKAIIKDAINDKYSKSVEIAPEIKSEKMNEGFVKKAAVGTLKASPWLGAGAMVGQAASDAVNKGAVGSTLDQINPRRDPSKKPEDYDTSNPISTGLTNPKSYTSDLALDLYSMVPVVGAIPSAISAKRNLERGDYYNAALDAFGAIPIAGWAAKGIKALSKGAKVASTMNKVEKIAQGAQKAGNAANLMQLGNVGGQVVGAVGAGVADALSDTSDQNTATAQPKKPSTQPVK